jgi:hypothetical protein
MALVELAAKNYKRGLWTKEMLLAMVIKKAGLTQADYDAIVGKQ